MTSFFATCARGLEPLLADELRAGGAREVRPVLAGVSFAGDLPTAYRVCLWSRTASRVLLALDRVDAASADALYDGVREIAWEDHVSPDGTIAVDFASDTNPAFRNSMYGAVRVKDAVVDRMRDHLGRRPSVDAENPDLRVNVRVRRGRATVSLDLSGHAMHRRGYREPGAQVAAPLKESLAAAVLLLSGWPRLAADGATLFDPMCGSGTLLVEGAWIAGDVAPGLLRSRWGFDGWLGHEADVWDALLVEADARAEAGLAALPPIAGSDRDARAIETAAACVARAGLKGRIGLDVSAVANAAPPGVRRGLLVANPPYGERLGESSESLDTYAQLGDLLRGACAGWEYAVLSGSEAHAAALGIVPVATHELHNGAIPVRLDLGRAPAVTDADATAGAAAFANRLRKNLRHLGKWAKREEVTCWRVYDADLPDFALAIDLYDCTDDVRRVVISEYEAPREVDAVKAAVRLEQARVVVPEVLGADPAEVRVKVRRRQRGLDQYERLAETGRSHEVREGSARLLVNLDDRLDTGLFLDHRITRAMVAELCAGRTLLNLFCYTGSVTVLCALAGATGSTSVDLSNTYLDWARRNLELNGIDAGSHRLVRADVPRYLEDAAGREERFGVVFVDPPSFSSSKRMEGTLDVQRDHAALLARAAHLLAPDGTLVFSTNLRGFKLDGASVDAVGLAVQDVTERTIPPDFERRRRIHRCYVLRRA